MTPDLAGLRIRARLTQGIEKMARDVAERTVERLNRAKARSLPGEAPADPDGNISGSVSVDIQGTQAQVIVAAPFAAFLELGTAKMAPRPFLLPAAQEVADQAEEFFEIDF